MLAPVGMGIRLRSRSAERRWTSRSGGRLNCSRVRIAGYVRCLHVFGNWLAAEELAEATASARAGRPPFRTRT
jgi:hypothetical protein